jgi:hypothetical protein
MAAHYREGAEQMKRTRKIRRIALGLAVAAVLPATAQARPLDTSGSDLRGIQQVMVPPVASVVMGPDDRAFSRQSSNTAALTADDSGLDYGTGSLGGLVLILAAAGSAVVVHHSRKAKLSPA